VVRWGAEHTGFALWRGWQSEVSSVSNRAPKYHRLDASRSAESDRVNPQWVSTSYNRVLRATAPSRSKGPVVLRRSFSAKSNSVSFDTMSPDKPLGVFQRLRNAVRIPATGIGLATVGRDQARRTVPGGAQVRRSTLRCPRQAPTMTSTGRRQPDLCGGQGFE
jgi:hypothetical protein